MWAMYGGLSPRKKGDTVEDIFVKIEFTYDQIKQLKNFNKEIKTHAIAYTQINKKERKIIKNLIYNCGSNKNTGLKSTDKILEGYIKDVAWSYENELRLCIKGTKQQQEEAKIVKLPENFIPQLKVFASPLYTTKEVQEIFDKHANSVPASNRPLFAPNNYEDTVLVKK